MISPDKSLTLTVGLCAFVSDWVVELMLTGGTEYYSESWDPTFALVFMFAGMLITGLWQNRQVYLEYLRPRKDGERGPPPSS